MRVLVALSVVVFLVTFLATPALGAGWFWDTGNALGFAAFCGLLYLTITSNRQVDVQAHQALSYGILFVAIAHAFWFLLGDAAVIEFARPGAPDYMWFGIISIFLLGILIIVALVPDRLRVHRDYLVFKSWHRVVALASIASATYHIVASGFYLHAWYQAVLFVSVAIVVSIGRVYWSRLGQMPVVTNTAYILVCTVFGGLFVVVRNLQF